MTWRADWWPPGQLGRSFVESQSEMGLRRTIRGRISRETRRPDIFISHSAHDKEIARNLALDLAICGVDAWFDEWEIHPGESLHAVIPQMLEQSSFVGIVVTPNFAESPWTKGELHQALASEKQQNTAKVLPLIFGEHSVPELADKTYVDMRGTEYYRGLFRLAAEIRGASLDRVSAAVNKIATSTSSQLFSVVRALYDCGVDLCVVFSKEDYDYLTNLPSASRSGNTVFPDPGELPVESDLSPTLKALVERLPENWKLGIRNIIGLQLVRN